MNTVECGTCHALVNAEALDLHREWHELIEECLRCLIHAARGTES